VTRSRAWGLAAAATLAACAAPEPPRSARVVGASPAGAGVTTALAEVEVRFDAPVEPAGIADGARIVVAPAEAVRDAVLAVDSEAGAAALASAVPAGAALEDGGARAVLRLRAPLRPFTPYAVVVSSRLTAVGGGAVLDPEGRRRPFTSPFETGAPAGPPPRPVLAEVRADAATPEAGGEYVELENRGAGPLWLAGHRLVKRTPAGALQGCALAAAPDDVLAAGARALIVGGAYDGRYALPAEAAIVACGATALAGGLANDRAPELALEDALGSVVATFGAAGAPSCPAAIERIDLDGPDAPENLACASGEGTPGACNSVSGCW
jgi:hypothetical protein